ncbi:MAG: heavy metal translocating P-type ATPase [Natronomonas sp.]
MSPERVELSVPEMDCPSCAGKVRSAIDDDNAVGSIETRATTGVVEIEYDPERTAVETLVAKIEAAGYQVTGTDGGVTAGQAVWRSHRAIATYIGAIGMVLGLFVWFAPIGDPAVWSFGREITVSDLFFVLATIVAGVPIIRAGIHSVRLRSLDMDLLMGTAIVAAMGVGYYVEAATLAVLFSTAELLEAHAMDRTRDSIRELLALSPETATIRRDGEERTVPAASVEAGDLVLVRPGERIPVDGVVVDGNSAVDQSPITGESVPVDKTPNDDVYAGTVLEAGYLEIEATAAGDETTLARVVELVEAAESRPTDAEQFVDRFADYYTPIVVFGALVTTFVPPLLFGAAWGTWFVRGLTLLVIACPCAFVISTPVTVVSGLTSAARNGVLVKGGDHLERLGEVDVVAFDKTGTLSSGDLGVTDVVPAAGYEGSDVLGIAAAIERYSEHPISNAIVEHATSIGDGDFREASNFENLAGEGVRGDLEETYYVGNPGLFEGLGIDLSAVKLRTDGGNVVAQSDPASAEKVPAVDTVPDLQAEGKTVVLVGTERDIVGVIAVADTIRPEAASVIASLDADGIRTVMLTGDNERTARAVGDRIGIDDVRAELLPDEKLEAIEELVETGVVAMVGDGVNDAPALARADVGVAMGAAGSDAALETADVALMADDLRAIPYCLDLSRKANGVIRQNIGVSLFVKLLLAIGAPLGYVSVIVAVLVGDMGMSLAVTGNAFRLGGVGPESE